MKGVRRFLAVLVAACLVMGSLPAVSRAATARGVSAAQLQEARSELTEQRLTAAMQKAGFTSVDGVIVPPEIAQSELYKSGRLPVIVTVGAKSVAEYAEGRSTTIGKLSDSDRRSAQATVKSAQQSVVNQAVSAGVNLQDVQQYGLLVAGFSAIIQTNSLPALINLVGRSNIHVQRMYSIKDTYSNSMIHATDAYTDPGVDGTGAVVGVIDTGVDYTHPAFGGDGTNHGFPTGKIVAGYDFAGDNADAVNKSDPSLLSRDADPMDSNGHGTHVSGIIAADGATVKGVAPKAKIVIAKIVPGNTNSAYTSSIVAAFEYMADPDNTDGGSEGTHPPVTSINMSFGSDSGFADPSDPENVAVEACVADGIFVSISAGNAGATNTDYPDHATVGAPSVTPGAMSVASIENTNATNYVVHESVTNGDYAYSAGSTSPVIHTTLTGSYHYVYCGLGLDSSYFPSSVPAGTLALIRRGSNSFYQKVNNAVAAGFVGAIIFNNQAGTISMNTTGATAPSLSITAADGATLKAQISGIVESASKPSTWPVSNGVVTFPSDPIVSANPAANTVSTFSSWGPAPDLSFKPDIAAPGGNIWSTVPIALGSYANYSGTSMASPHVAGAAALVRLANPSWSVTQTKLALSNTAALLVDPDSSTGAYYSPCLMGSGLINVQDAAKTKVLVSRTGSNTASVALGSIDDWNSTPITFGLTLSNFGATSVTYNAAGTVQWTGKGTLEAETIPGASLSVSPASVTVPAGETRNVTVTVNAAGVALSSSYYPYVEGFVVFTPTSGSTINLHVPYMGFLGNWNDFNESDIQFNPVTEPATDAEGAPYSVVASAKPTWLYSLDIYNTYSALLPIGADFNGNVHAEDAAINPGSSTTSDYFYGTSTSGLVVGLNMLRDLDHLTITVEDSSHAVVKQVADVPLSTLEQMGKGFQIGDYNLWSWDGTNGSGSVVPDGKYYVVAHMTPQQVVNKVTKDADQAISMPVSVDTVNPTVSITDIVPNGSTQTVSWTSADAAPSSGIAGYTLYWSSDGWSTHQSANLPPSATSYAAVPRGAEVDLYVTDYAGNYTDATATPQDVAMSTTLPNTVTIGTQTAFSITAQNWGNQNFSPVRYDITVSTPSLWQASDITLQYLKTGGDPSNESDWLPLTLTGSNGSFTTYFGPHAGFTFPASTTWTTPLRVTFASGSTPGKVTLAAQMDLLDGSENPTGDPVSTLTASTYAISAPLDFTVSPSVLPTGYTNTAYAGATFTATGGVGAPYVFSCSNLPSGLALSADGVLSGTPVQVGSFALHVTVANADGGLTLAKDFPLTIAQGPGVALSWEPLAGGSITGNTAVPQGGVGVFVVTANPGYAIGQILWDGSVLSVTSPVSQTVTEPNLSGSHTLHAVFYPIVIVAAGDHGTVTPGTGAVALHSSATYVVQPGVGYLISSLTVDGVSVQDALRDFRPYALVLSDVTTPHIIQAGFSRIPDTQPPIITIPSLAGLPSVVDWRMNGNEQTITVGDTSFTLPFSLYDDRGTVTATVSVNGTVVAAQSGLGDKTCTLPLQDGSNEVMIVAKDAAGNTAMAKVMINVVVNGPSIQLDQTSGSKVSSANFKITGTVRDSVSGVRSVAINGTPVALYADGHFEEEVTLAKGMNSVLVEATNNASRTSQKVLTVDYESQNGSGSGSGTGPSASFTVVLTIGQNSMQINGMPTAMDAAPLIKNGRTLLPIRALMEAIGGSASWNATAKTATVKLGDRIVVLTIGKNVALVGGKQVTIDASNTKVVPEIIKGRTYLPLRFIAENLGLDLAWDASSQTISFTYWP